MTAALYAFMAQPPLLVETERMKLSAAVQTKKVTRYLGPTTCCRRSTRLSYSPVGEAGFEPATSGILGQREGVGPSITRATIWRLTVWLPLHNFGAG